MIKGIEKELLQIDLLVKKKGFLYALLMIIIEDITFANQLNSLDNQERISNNELRLLMGFLVKMPIDLSYQDFKQVLGLKKECRNLLQQLHMSWCRADSDLISDLSDFIKSSNILTETFFYSGAGTDEYQIFKYYEEKYNSYRDVLNNNHNFKLVEFKDAFFKVKASLENKIKSAFILEPFDVQLSDNTPQELQDLLELSIYRFLLIDAIKSGNKNKFFDDLLELFLLDYKNLNHSFLDCFSLEINDQTNKDFNTIGDRNLIYDKPIIKLNDGRYLLLDIFLLAESIYEHPNLKLLQNKAVAGEYGRAVGEFFELQTFELLKPLFEQYGEIYKNVNIYIGKDLYTDIDILVIFDNRAIVFQVKSKGLTLQARGGEYDKIVKDFNLAMGNAYNQGVKSKDALLNQNKFRMYSDGRQISFSNIAIVDIILITSANYPALTTKSSLLLNINDSESRKPVCWTLFDLEFILHFLKNSYEFLHYVDKRTRKDRHYEEIGFSFPFADSELTYLGAYVLDNLEGVSALDHMLVTPLNNEFVYCKKNQIEQKDSHLYLNEELKSHCETILLGSNTRRLKDIFSILDKKHITHNKNLVSKTLLQNTVDSLRKHYKQGRNERCNCNSGVKYKKCCGRNL